MLEEGLRTAQVLQSGTAKKLARILHMGTYAAAGAAMLEDYGLAPGCAADLVLLDAPSPRAALVERCARTLVLKHGKIVAENGRLV
jgi:cytosine deaminase